MSKLEVGDSARVFEVTKEYYDKEHHGKWSSERNDKYFNHKYGVNLHFPTNLNHFGIDERNDARLVGRLTVTKVK